jgi:O-antigen/teichoic acid export membrane protein
MATATAVGNYGAAYRLLEATMFIATSLTGGFVAMFTYLNHESKPSIQGAFTGSIRLACAALVPIALVFGLLADDVIDVFYGDELAGAASCLRLLAPVVVLLALVVLTSSLIVSRESPRRIVGVTAAVTVLNVALNVALIPLLGAEGAAVSMLVTELVFSAVALRLAHRLIGSAPWLRSLAGVIAGAAIMALLTHLLREHWLVAGVAGVLGYAAALLVVDRRIARIALPRAYE